MWRKRREEIEAEILEGGEVERERDLQILTFLCPISPMFYK
jgi:hypothetical protein